MNKIYKAKIFLSVLILILTCAAAFSCKNPDLPDVDKKPPYTPDIPGLEKIENDEHCFDKWEYVTEPTCEERGSVRMFCSECDEVRIGSVAALGHEVKTVKGTPATCTENGMTSYEICTRCSSTVKAADVIYATGHKAKTVEGKSPTCTEEGFTESSVCKTCGEILEAASTLEPTGHLLVKVDGKAASCIEDGFTESVVCSECGLVETEAQVIFAKGHTSVFVPGVEPDCVNGGYSDSEYCEVCGLTLLERVPIDPKGHSPERMVDTEPTCEESGYSNGEYCTVCGEILAQPGVIPPLGHSPMTLAGYAPTCTDGGLTDGVYCSACGLTLTEQSEIEPLGHSPMTLAGYASTCTESGLTDGEYCSACGLTLTEQSEIEPLGHSPKTIAGYASTCVQEGLTDGEYCSVCKEILVEQVKLPLSQCSGEWIVTVPATESSTGTMSMTCQTCGKTVTDEIPCLPYTAGLEYELGNGYYILVGIGHATDTHINIPTTYRGLPVAKIAPRALKDQTQIQSITVHDSVTYIGYAPFAGCSGLTELTVPFIGDVMRTLHEDDHYPLGYFFGTTEWEGSYGCIQLVGERNAPHSEVLFYIPTALRKVTVNGGDIHAGAFEYCTHIEELVFGDDVRGVEAYSLMRCDSLTNVTLPYLGVYSDGVEEYSLYHNNLERMFGFNDTIYSRPPLNTVTVKVTKAIGAFALGYDTIFKNFDNGLRLVIGKDVEKIEEKYGYDIYAHNLISVEFEEGSRITEVWGIGGYYGIVEPVVIPESVEKIGYFGPCDFYVSDLEKFILGYVGKIDGDIYCNGKLVTELVLPTGMSPLVDRMFENCTSVKKIYVSGGIEIGTAFVDSSIEEVVLLPGVTALMRGAFSNCQNLEKVYLPDSLHTIENGAFSSCPSLKYLLHTEGDTSEVKTSSESVFYLDWLNNSLEYLYIPASVSRVEAIGDSKIIEIGEGCLNISFESSIYIFSLEELHLPDSLKTFKINNADLGTAPKVYIGTNLEYFKAYVANTDMQIHAKNIADCIKVDYDTWYIFETYVNGKRLEGDVVIPESVEKIGRYAFWGVGTMTSLTLPESIRYIGENAFREYFQNLYIESIESWCNIEFANAASNPMTYSSKIYIEGSGDYDTIVIPEGVTEIKDHAFCGISDYGTSVILPSTLTRIGENALGTMCLSKIPDSVKYIGDNAIYNANNVFDKLPSSLEYIGNQAIRGTVRSVHIGKALTHIGYNTFLIGDGMFTVEEGHGYFEISGGLLIDKLTSTVIGVTDNRTRIVVPDGVLYIAPYVFSYRAFQSVKLNDGLLGIGEGAFLYCEIESVVIPDSVTEIGKALFANSTVKSVVLGSGITEIPMSCFGSSSIESIVIPKNVSLIGQSSFAGASIKNLTIEASNATVFMGAFDYCTLLESITVGNTTVNLEFAVNDIDNFEFNEYEGGRYFGSKDNPYRIFVGLIDTSVTSVTLHPDTVAINTGAFLYSSITAIVIPDNVTHIGPSAFGYCSALTSVVLPEGLISIGDGAFYGTEALKAIDIPHTVKYIDEYAFAHSGITGVIIPNEILHLGEFAFANTPLKNVTIGEFIFGMRTDEYPYYTVFVETAVEHVTLHSGITAIPDNAFFGLFNGLKSVTLPDSVIFIGKRAFYGCPITSITLPQGLTEIGSEAFCGTQLTEIVIPSGVKYIADSTFYQCPLTKVTLPEGLLEIGDYAFYCSRFSEIELPSTLTLIGESAFADSYLERITLHKGITQVKDQAFCASRLEEIDVFTKDCSFGQSVFKYCDIVSVNIDLIEDWVSNCFASSDSYPVQYVTRFTVRGEEPCDVVIPEGVERIEAYAFMNIRSIKSLSLPNSLRSVGASAFDQTYIEKLYIGDIGSYLLIDFANINSSPVRMASSTYLGGKPLDRIVIPDGITEIKPYAFAFANTESDTIELILSDSVVRIGEEAFYNMGKLSALYLANVKEIGDGAFAYCYNLREITIPDSVSVIGEEAFARISNIDVVTLGKGLVKIGADAFKNSATTAGFGGITRLNLPSIELLGNIEFANSDSLPGSYFPYEIYVDGKLVEELNLEGIKHVISGMFSNLSVKTVIVPASVETIETYAFQGSTLEKLVFEQGGTCEIGEEAFAYCNNLKEVTLYSGKIESCAFAGCVSLEKVSVMSEDVLIEKYAFQYSSVKEVYITAESVTLMDYAFSRCYDLELVRINSIEVIEHPRAFYGYYGRKM